MICRKVCARVVEDVDLTGLFSFASYVAQKTGCKVKVTVVEPGTKIEIEVCCLRSRKVISAIKSRIMMMKGVEERSCLIAKGSPDAIVKGMLVLGSKLCLGRVADTGAPFCLPSKWLKRHTLIVGSTGSGKSTTAKRLFSELDAKKVMLDWHGEHAGLAKTIDCVSLNSLDVLDKLELMDALANSLNLSDAQYYLLLKVVQLLKSRGEGFGIRDIIFQLKSLEEASRWMRESKYSLLRKLEMLTHRTVCRYKIVDVVEMSDGGLVVDLSPYTTEYAKRFVAHVILSILFTRAKAGEVGELYAFVEEAHNVMPKSSEPGIVDKIFMEGRKYGLHLVVITQSPRSMSENAVKNSGTKIIHALKEVDDAKYMAESVGDPQLWKDLVSLDVGEAVVAYKRPIKVVIDSTQQSVPSPRRPSASPHS